MKNRIIFVLLLSPLIVSMNNSCVNDNKSNFMVITTNSTDAMELYREAYAIAFKIVELDKAVSLYEEAAEKDPGFFIAYYQLATYFLFHKDYDEFEKNAKAAVNSRLKLSKGELIQKQALEEWLKDKEKNNSDLGKQLVKLYPNDPDAYLNLGFYEYMAKNYEVGAIAFENAIAMQNPDDNYCGPKLAIVPVCMLGYTYLTLGQMDKAKSSFDQYIAQFPNDQNPYDCKADYFIAVKKYDKAYESYMKAYLLDTTKQGYLERAENVKALIENKEER